MAKTLDNKLKQTDSWDYKSALKEALAERDQLLKSIPELTELQKEIDLRLSGVESFEERMTIIGKMIGSSLDNLYNECNILTDICSHIGINTQLPILELKKNQASSFYQSRIIIQINSLIIKVQNRTVKKYRFKASVIDKFFKQY